MHPLDMTMDPAELQVTVPQGRERFCIGAVLFLRAYLCAI